MGESTHSSARTSLLISLFSFTLCVVLIAVAIFFTIQPVPNYVGLVTCFIFGGILGLNGVLRFKSYLRKRSE